MPKPGFLTIHVGPVLPPSEVQMINERYRAWAETINPNAYPPEDPAAVAARDRETAAVVAEDAAAADSPSDHEEDALEDEREQR